MVASIGIHTSGFDWIKISNGFSTKQTQHPKTSN
jgi:hypothetical protein